MVINFLRQSLSSVTFDSSNRSLEHNSVAVLASTTTRLKLNSNTLSSSCVPELPFNICSVYCNSGLEISSIGKSHHKDPNNAVVGIVLREHGSVICQSHCMYSWD